MMKLKDIIFYGLAVMSVYLIARLFIGPGSYSVIWDLEEKVAQQTTQNEMLEARNVALETDVNGLRNPEHEIEEYARSELGMVKPGETFFQVILDDQEQTYRVQVPTPEVAPKVE